MWRDFVDYDKLTFTQELRRKFGSNNLWGKRVRFRYRRENGKSKKVSGKLFYISHRPGRGFALHLKQVKWMGHYFGGLILVFPTRNIVWVSYEIPKLLGSGKVERG